MFKPEKFIQQFQVELNVMRLGSHSEAFTRLIRPEVSRVKKVWPDCQTYSPQEAMASIARADAIANYISSIQ